MNKPLISVVIPTYNRKNTILRAIESVLTQTYTNYELIIIDDGSTDGTYDVIKTVIDKNKIRYFQTENSGVCAARNYGIKQAKGEYISLLDSDDEYLSNRLEKQVELLLSSEADLCISNRFEYFEDSDIRKNNLRNTKSFSIKTNSDVLSGIPLSATLLMFNKKVTSQILFDEKLPAGNDLDFILRVLKNHKVYFYAEPLNVIYKGLGYKRISTDYSKKIIGYERILQKYARGSYLVSNDRKDIFLFKILFNLSVFYILSNSYEEARKHLRKSLDLEEISLYIKAKSYILYVLSFAPVLLRTLIKGLTYLWGKGISIMRN